APHRSEHRDRRAPPAGLAAGARHLEPRRVDGRRRVHPVHLEAATGGGDHLRVRHQGGPPRPDRRDGGHLVVGGPGDGRAPHRRGHRRGSLHPAPGEAWAHPLHLGGAARVPVVARRPARRRGRSPGAEADLEGQPPPSPVRLRGL
ncbi:MAG: hypothetical protein AVDCRST_MAG20-161, partial [uncultured Acidimicrobiales bacterium]